MSALRARAESLAVQCPLLAVHSCLTSRHGSSGSKPGFHDLPLYSHITTVVSNLPTSPVTKHCIMASHEDAINQLCAITATETTMGRRSIEQVLRSTDWNVEVSSLIPFTRRAMPHFAQRAADLIFSNPEALRQSEAVSERKATEPRPRRVEPRDC